MTDDIRGPKDPLGDRMKGYEKEFSFNLDHKLVENYLDQFMIEDLETRSLPYYPYMRIDGRSFSRFTKQLAYMGILKKPRDADFESIFVNAVKDTVKEFNLALGFHQSDEISLFFQPITEEMYSNGSQMIFNGNLQKLVSVIPSYFTASFVIHFHQRYKIYEHCSFDARMVVFDNYAEATNMLVWRYKDASRNLIQDHAHHMFSDKELFKKSTREKFEMIGSPKMYPGNFIKRETYQHKLMHKQEYGDNNFTGSSFVTRSRVVLLPPVEFDQMNFRERASLIYGKEFIDNIHEKEQLNNANI